VARGFTALGSAGPDLADEPIDISQDEITVHAAVEVSFELG
jgi:hypothetical protein